MIKGYVTNNTGRSKHIFKRTVYPGQQLDLEYIFKIIGNQVPEGASFEEWLGGGLPPGWEVNVVRSEASSSTGGRPYREVLTAIPEVLDSSDTPEQVDIAAATPPPEDAAPSLQYSTPRAIDKMTAKDLYDLRLKDNPKRILKHVTSIHKLRRTLSMCKNDTRKAVLTRLVQGRIRQLNLTL